MSLNINLEELSFEELKQLIEDAEKEVVRKRKAEVRSLRQKAQQLAGDLNMTTEQIFGFDKKKASKTVGEPKFRNPENPAETWTGRGKRPGWFVKAEEKGISRDQMRI